MNPKPPDQALEGRTRSGSAVSLGEQLRRARESRHISLREISEQTRISTRYLEAIESDDYKQLPGGIFNRSFIKAYARYVGVSEDEAVEAYARLAHAHGESPDEVVTTPYQPRVYTDGDSTRSPLVNLLLSALILGVISLGVYALWHWYENRGQNRAGDPATQTTQPPTDPAANRAASQPTPAPARLNVQVRALGERVWIGARVDEGDREEATLAPGEMKEFTPEQRMVLQYARSMAKALEVSINGRPAKIPTDFRTNSAEMVITRDNYEQYYQ